MLCVAVTIAAIQIGGIVQRLIEPNDVGWLPFATWSPRIRDFSLLGFGAVLVAVAPRRSGLTFGNRRTRRAALIACALVVALALGVRFGVFDFAGLNEMRLRLVRGCPSLTSWAVSPLAQELIFTGFVLGYLQEHFPKRVHPNLPVTGAVVMTALLFGLWHFVPDHTSPFASADFTAFRFAYTVGGMLVYGVVRLWTGSILYSVITHTAVNYMFLGGFSCMVTGIGFEPT